MITTDLEGVNPQGRLDVLLYRGVEHLVKQFESTQGLQGIWETTRPVVNEMVVKGLTGIEIPTELKMILGIIQANWK